jgi:amino acid transporter
MNEQPQIPNVHVLKRVLGFPSLYVIAIGVVTAQSCFVSTLQGAGIGGGSFFIALIIAFCLTLCYVSTYSELSLMMPKAASISLYTAVAMGHFPAIIATLSGYLAPLIFGGPAELLLVEYVLNVAYPNVFHNVGFIILIVLTISNLLGIDIFSSVQNFLTYSMLTAGLLLGFAGLNPSIAGGLTSVELWHQFTHTETSVFSLVVLAIWAFLSLEFICPLIEESKQPEKNIPKTLFLAAFTILVLYGLIAYAGMKQVPAKDLTESDIPHWLLGEALFGNFGRLLIVVFSITSTSGVTNCVLATIPRMLKGMAHKNQMPPIFKTLHPRWKTPWFGILFASMLQAIPLLIFKNMPDALMILVISAATCWLLTYIVAHIDVLILRKKYPHFPRPFKSPFYPIPQILGILGMSYAFFNNAPTPEMTVKVYTNSAIFMGITALYAFFWVRFKMKKRLFEAETMEEALIN